MDSYRYISYWDVCLDNIPDGRFERRVIGAGEDAVRTLDDARDV